MDDIGGVKSEEKRRGDGGGGEGGGEGGEEGCGTQAHGFTTDSVTAIWRAGARQHLIIYTGQLLNQ